MAKTKSSTASAARIRAAASLRLTYGAETKIPVHRLPFVGFPGARKAGISFWNVPATGGYEGGCDTGGALATAYLRHLQANPEYQGGLLQHIVIDMCKAYKRGLTDDEDKSLRGQIVGFFSAICATLQNTAPIFRYRLDVAEETQILTAANAGLAETRYVN